MSPPDGTNVQSGGTSGGASSAAVVSGGASSAVVSGGSASSVTSGGAASSGTVISGGASSASTPAWADDWRKTMAKGDDKGVKRLERYASPEAVFDALTAAQTKIDSGQIRPTLAADATPEQITEFRKANGIPETADKYDLTLPNGLVIGEADKPLVDGFLKHAHGKNWTPDRVKEGLEWYYGQQDAIRKDQETKDAVFKQESTAELGKKYGGDFKRNVAHVDAYLEEFPPGIKDKVLGARLPNGRLAGSDPDFIDFLYQQALFKNPIATVMGGNSEANVKAAEVRMEELRKMSGDRQSPYWKGPQSEKLREEYLQLIEGTEKIKAARR